MKIAKALKQKNVLVGELSTLKSRLLENNIRTDGQKKFNYDNIEVYLQVLNKLNELVDIKAKIASTNASVYGDIFKMSELKSLIETLKIVPVKEGTEKVPSYRGETQEVTYFSAINRVALDLTIKELEKQVQELQDKLDTFNFTTEI